MARHDFERDFSRKLQEREIQPSENSWEQLQSKLEASEKKKKSVFSLKWMGIAASLVGGLLILGLMFNSDGGQQTPEIVDTPSEEIQKEDQNQLFEKVEIASEEIDKVEKEESSETKDKVIVNTVPTPKNSVVAAVEVKEKTNEKEEDQVDPQLQIAQTGISGKLEAAVAEISSEEESANLTDPEVEELLRKAAEEISTEKMYANTQNVDAGSLLWEVEMELEKTFRNKVFDALKESYLKTKTAVANRGF